MNKIIFCVAVLICWTTSIWAQASKITPEATKTYEEISRTFGLVPTFLTHFPQESISGVWQDMKNLQWNSNSTISGKYKELIGLAVAAQIPCPSCAFLHTEAARLNGASNQEIKEAVAMAAITRRWATFLSGTQTGEMDFRNEVDKMLAFSEKKKKQEAMEVKPQLELKTPQDAYTDIKNTFGFVPGYLVNYPKQSLVGVWKEIKELEMNPTTEIPLKYKQLIGLAVASQVPCSYCTYYHTQTAIFRNASKDEILEAVAMAGITQQLSTVLNGHVFDENKFKLEVNQIMKFFKSKSVQTDHF